MTEPIKFDPRIHVIVPREATDEQYRKADEAFWERKHSGRNVCYESIYKAMIAAAPPITIEAPSPVTKEQAREALSEFERLVKFAEANGHVSKHDKAIIETIRALLEAAAQQTQEQSQ